MVTVITIKLIKPNGGPVAFRCHLVKQGEGLPYIVSYKDRDEKVSLPDFEAPLEFTKEATAFLDAFGKHIVMQAEKVATSLKEHASKEGQT